MGSFGLLLPFLILGGLDAAAGAGRLEGVSDGERQAGALRSNQVSPKSIMDQLLVLVMIQAVTAVGIGGHPSCHSCWYW